MIKIGTNFEYLGEQFLDGRQEVELLSSLESWGSPVPLGFEVFVNEKNAWYIYVGTDSTTGNKIWVPRLSTELVREEYRSYVGVTQAYVGETLEDIQSDIDLLISEKFKYKIEISPESRTKKIGFNYETGGGVQTLPATIITIKGSKMGDGDARWFDENGNEEYDTKLFVKVGTGSYERINKNKLEEVSGKPGEVKYTVAEENLSYAANSTSTDPITRTLTFYSQWYNKKKKIWETSTTFPKFTTQLDRDRVSTYIYYIQREAFPTEDEMSGLIADIKAHGVQDSTANLSPNKSGRICVLFGSRNKSASISVGGFTDSNWTIYGGNDRTDSIYGPYTLYVHNNYMYIEGAKVVVS